MSLRDYQILMRDHILGHKRSMLFCGVGLGKTYATLGAIDALMFADVERVLVCGPLRVARMVWRLEAELRFPGMTVEFIGGSRKEIAEKIAKSTAQVHCINYEQVPFLVSLFENKPWPYTMLVCDECSRLRGFRTRQGTQRAAALASVAFKSKYYVGLTGTPCPNGVAGLWGATYFVDRGQRLGKSFASFENRWFTSAPGADGYQQIRALPHAQTEIEGLIKDVCLSIDVSKYMDIHEPIVSDVWVDLPEDARKAYKKMEKDFYVKLGEHSIEAFNAAAKSNKLLQFCSGSAYTDTTGSHVWIHDSKIEALDSIVEEYNGAPVLVAYNYRFELPRILGRFIGRARHLDSEADFADWNAGKIQVGVIHPASAGHGLSLQHGGNVLVYFGPSWDLELTEQVLGRIGPVRQAQSGYNRPVFVHRILARNTIDTVVAQRLTTKRSVQDCLMAAMQQSTS